MNISPVTVSRLRQSGWNIVRVSNVLDARSKDSVILRFARKQNRILITQDTDFSMLLALGGYSRPSVMTIRLRNPRPESVTKRILQIVREMEENLREGIVVSVDEVSARYRRLPIRS